MSTASPQAAFDTGSFFPCDAARVRIGEKAFRWLLDEVRGHRLKPAEAVHALGLMVRLTEQFCVHRKRDLIVLAMGLAESEAAHRDVRSAAARIVAVATG